jgi:uncharacterized protein with PIN domain/sulfur carrier protein ThiS
MFTTTFRFHGSLNDFLSPAQRERDIVQQLPEAAAVKHPIESLGAPHTEVAAILVNGRAVEFGYRLQDGDRVEVYPQELAHGLGAYLPLRPPLPEPVRFVADTHLGRLAAYLRLLGFDTLYRNDYDDHELAGIAAEEQRVLLTRDRGLLKHKRVVYGYCVRESDPQQQVSTVLRRYRLTAAAQPWRRCSHCNGLLHTVAKSAVLPQLEPKTKLYYDDFQQCEVCGQVYWQGSHFARLAEFVENVLRSSS